MYKHLKTGKASNLTHNNSALPTVPHAPKPRAIYISWQIAGLVIVLAFVAVYAVILDFGMTAQPSFAGNSTYAGLYAGSYTGGYSATQTCGQTDLSCLINQGGGYANAAIHCASPINNLNDYDVKWTDDDSHPMFSVARWAPEGHGAIEYIGDRAKFENAYGTYSNVVYACDLAANNKTVLRARIVREGFLSDD